MRDTVSEVSRQEICHIFLLKAYFITDYLSEKSIFIILLKVAFLKIVPLMLVLEEKTQPHKLQPERSAPDFQG